IGPEPRCSDEPDSDHPPLEQLRLASHINQVLPTVKDFFPPPLSMSLGYLSGLELSGTPQFSAKGVLRIDEGRRRVLSRATMSLDDSFRRFLEWACMIASTMRTRNAQSAARR